MSDESISSLALNNKLIGPLKTTEFWTQFLHCIGLELDDVRSYISEKKDLYDINVQLEDGLINLAKMFGYNPNLIVDNSYDMVKSEVASIPFRIRSKTTYSGYDIIFKQIKKLGDVYNYYWSGLKLVKAVKWNDIAQALNDVQASGKSYADPFFNIIPDKNFSTISNTDGVYLDSGMFLDTPIGEVMWTLDEDIEISPTKHLGIEYYVRDYNEFDVNGEALMTTPYMLYLANGVDYTRRVPIVPHNGLQICGILHENAGFNFYSSDPLYSCPDLKLTCSTTFQYNKAFVSYSNFSLDNEMTLDAVNKWTLDKETKTDTKFNMKDIKYISCGASRLNMMDEDYALTLFPYDKMFAFYTFDDEDDTFTIKDFSLGEHDAEIVCDGSAGDCTKKIKGILGRTINFDGGIYVRTKQTVQIVTGTWSFGFWINPNSIDSEYYDEPQTVLDFTFMQVYYDYSTEELTIDFKGQTLSFTVEKNTVNSIIIELSVEGRPTLRAYKNGEYISPLDIEGVDYSGETYLYFGADSNGENNFVGILDSIWIFNKLFTPVEMKYIYENRIEIITRLAKKLGHYEIDSRHEMRETDDWMLIQSYVKSNDIDDEFAFFADKSVESEEELVNVFYNGHDVRVTMESEPTTVENYRGFAFSFMEAYYNGVDYIYTKDDGTTFYRHYEVVESALILTDLVDDPTGYTDTGYGFYIDVIHITTTLILNSYVGRTNFYPSKEGYFSVVYEKLTPSGLNTETVELRANKEGNFYNAKTNKDVSGHIDFETGEYEINSITDRYATQEKLINTLSRTDRVICNLAGTSEIIGVNDTSEVKPKTLVLRYKVNGEVHTARDDGEGVILGVGLNGTIDYNTRLLILNLTGWEFDNNITADYTYLEDLGMIENEPVRFNYKLETSEITEMALENEDHEVLVYMTFPPIKFDTIYNHVSALFAIQKLQDIK